jgi:hypothetical protein
MHRVKAGPRARRPRVDRRLPESRSSVELANSLLHYLATRYQCPKLCYLSRPAVITEGWETNIFYFGVHAPDSLPAQLDRPLCLRLYSGENGLASAQKEYDAQRGLRRLGYPTPTALLCELDCSVLGGPFLVTEQVEGPTLFEKLLANHGRLQPCHDRWRGCWYGCTIFRR